MQDGITLLMLFFPLQASGNTSAGIAKYFYKHKSLILITQARRRGGGCSRGSNEPPLEVNNGGLKTQTVDFQLLANSGGMENKLKLPCKKTLIVL